MIEAAGASAFARFWRPVSKLASGTALSQIIVLVSATVMARLFAPAAVGAYATVVATATIISLVVTGRYEVAIPAVRMPRTAAALETLAFRLNAISWVALATAAAIYGAMSLLLGWKAGIDPWAWLAGTLVVYTTASNQILVGQANRHALFGCMAKSRILTSSINVVLVAAAGLFAPKAVWLILIMAVSQTAANVFLARALGRLRVRPALSRRYAIALARQHKSFPRYMMPSDALNATAQYAPIFLFTLLFSVADTGAFSLMQRALVVPLTLVSGAIQEVFKAELLRAHKAGMATDLFRGTARMLALVAVLFFLGSIFIAPRLFPLLFGERWAQVGLFTQIMAVGYAMKFMASPLSYVLTFKRRLKLDFHLHIILIVCSTGLFGVGAFWSDFAALWLYSIALAVIYGVYVIVSWKVLARE